MDGGPGCPGCCCRRRLLSGRPEAGAGAGAGLSRWGHPVSRPPAAAWRSSGRVGKLPARPVRDPGCSPSLTALGPGGTGSLTGPRSPRLPPPPRQGLDLPPPLLRPRGVCGPPRPPPALLPRHPRPRSCPRWGSCSWCPRGTEGLGGAAAGPAGAAEAGAAAGPGGGAQNPARRAAGAVAATVTAAAGDDGGGGGAGGDGGGGDALGPSVALPLTPHEAWPGSLRRPCHPPA